MTKTASSLSGTRLARLSAAAIITSLVTAVGFSEIARTAEVRHEQDEYLRPTGKGTGERDPSGMTERGATKFAPNSNNGIFYHGGPVMLGSVNLYYIWYGAWDFPNDTTQSLLGTFRQYIGGTPYFNINTTYYNANNQAVSGQVQVPPTGADLIDTGSQGTALSDAAVQNIVANALLSNKLPTDPNGVYFVMTSKEVTETSGFCTQYCAWHSHATINSQDIKFGFVGNPLQCPSACLAQTTTPNGNMAADGMANMVAHELSESVTDPQLNAWFDRRGMENADKCVWKFGATNTLSSGAKYNVTFASKNWLLQQNWINAGGGSCTLAK